MLEVLALSFNYGNKPILRGLDMVLKRGETIILTGPSGIGKTTLLRLIAGLEVPKSGKIIIDNKIMSNGQDIMPPHERSLGIVFQEPSLWSHMKVWEHLNFVLKTNKKYKRKEKINNLLMATGLSSLADRFPGEISAGQAQKLSIAVALAAEPKYILLDEAFSNLDAESKKNIIDLIKSESLILNAGILLITHSEEEADAMGGKQLLMKDGKVWEKKVLL